MSLEQRAEIADGHREGDASKPAPWKAFFANPPVRETAATIAVVVLLIVAMDVASWYVPDYIMPSPMAVLQAILRLADTDFSHVFITLARLGAALAFSLIVGVLLGLVMGISPLLRPFIRAFVIIDTGIPALSWILLAVFWFKNPETRIFFILIMILVPFYTLSIYDGIRALPKDWIDMIESFRPSQAQTLRFLIVPHIVPYILMTTKSVIGYATRMVIFAELVASAVGVGSRMGLAQSTFHIDEVLAWTFFLIILNIALQLLVTGVEKLALSWRPKAEVR
ncbi:ABC transporter permease subunit [Bradyrhizobium sp. Arg237L]|uniref:ABC transporter permease n=1 Tax=Bradyrhizobium sp. Arg237L TaxID=3003352 RepID=UPI00249F8F3F|nr:ABC transporter permease subunit [Bradyrhizobium sp. Arg237L]MDI4238275.1 ABC transporter permease subunit [Bradyrhizobium sp. Arg237L]